jgi:hypothetical protein
MKQIISGVRGYSSERARRVAIRQLMKQGFNHFVGFRDVQSEFALAYGKAEWASDRPYFNDCYPMHYGRRIVCFSCGKQHVVRPEGCSK